MRAATGTPGDRASGWRQAVVATASVGGLSLAVVAFYLPVYRVRGFDLPVGFDASWYVWRAVHAAEAGIGPVGTAVRPGHAVLSAVVGAVTGRSQLQLAVLMPLVLAAVFALGVGAQCRRGLGWRRPPAVAAVVVAGTLLGATRLVGENVANLLLLAIVVAALVALGEAVDGGRVAAGPVVLLVAAGMAHWMFLAVVGAVLGMAAALATRSSLEERRAGTPLLRTEAGLYVATGAITAAVVLAAIWAVLRAALQTFEIREDPDRFGPKLRTDLGRLFAPVTAPAAAAGAWLLWRGRDLDAERRVGATSLSLAPRRRRSAIRLLGGWALVAALGVAFGVWTGRLPPHRFLAMGVTLPGAVALATAVVVASRAVGGRFERGRRGATVLVSLVAICLVAVPGAAAWYRHGPGVWLDGTALQQAAVASVYANGLPAGQPLVVLVGPRGRAGVLSIPLKERTIRVALPPDRQGDLHLFVGDPEDLLAGRRTVFEGGPTDQAALPYWTDVRTVLPLRPPVVILQRFAPGQFDRAVQDLGATRIGPGVALLQGPPPTLPLEPPGLEAPVPTIEGGMIWAAVILAVLGLAGLGWTTVFVGPRVGSEVAVALSPAVGSAVLMLVAIPVARAGIGVGGAIGVSLFVGVSLVGWVLSASRFRRDSSP